MDKEILLSLSQINKDVRRENKSVRNRLQSILLDNKFLQERVVSIFPHFPIVPNERCGLWYCEPSTFKRTSYFKSTDGHVNQWDFSTRRLNFHLLETIRDKKGIIIIDSTRRGKKIPDSLSKTVPIWCAVLNTIMLQKEKEDVDIDKVLYVPPETVPKSEYDMIKRKIPELVAKLKKLNVVDSKKLNDLFMGKILRPIWVHPGSSLLNHSVDYFTGELKEQETWEAPKDQNIIPIILCTVSYQAQDGMDKRYGFTYVQGAADDHELWSFGLDSEMFWSHVDYLGDTDKSDDQLHDYITDLVAKKLENQLSIKDKGSLDEIFGNIDIITNEISLGKVIQGLTISVKLKQELKLRYDKVIVFSDSVAITEDTDHEEESSPNSFISVFKLQSGDKKSSKTLRTIFPRIHEELQSAFANRDGGTKPILICCNTGTDMSIGVILSILCTKYTEDWKLTPELPEVNKIIIRRHLTKLISHLRGRNVNPSRATLNSVNSFLM
ncbi:Rit1p [Saccharomyces cerevisiae x Saccharomyces kudriavzevii VIN7]|uniref:Rit1p n=1 Tax=Saccharomyces cerevisiae x Saccharomyces kudriavzevii (strain VIN7) TaxID=1095631 RepID=H0GZQ2_SACCK|nr:Rit1p [Saccharomyces cerevisiae x Saccharomyces kudriavzevii VIN7]